MNVSLKAGRQYERLEGFRLGQRFCLNDRALKHEMYQVIDFFVHLT